jgi:hypothetical protein
VAALLRLNAPWVPSEPDRLGDLAISRGSDDVLTHDDGISLSVEVLDPVPYETLEEVAAALGLAPAPRESMDVRVSADPWRTGVHRRASAQFDDWTATVAHPIRVWCDLHAEERGREFASQLLGSFPLSSVRLRQGLNLDVGVVTGEGAQVFRGN